MKSKVSIKIRRTAGNEDFPLPSYQSAGASGMDVSAAIESSIWVPPGQIALIPCGFAIALPSGYEAQLRPRSGLAAKFGITLINSPGTVDADYRGEIKVALVNLGIKKFEITRGLRIAQLVIAPVTKAKWNEVKELQPTTRNSGGFGHTGG